MITGKHKREMDELKAALAKADDRFCDEKIKRMNAEAELHRARTGSDEETNDFFRAHMSVKAIEQDASTGAAGKLPKKPRAKKD